VLWLILGVLAFWWFQFRHISAFEEYWATFDGEAFKHIKFAPKQDYDAVVIHFIDDECPCSRFAKQHIADLEDKFSSEVEFLHSSALNSESLLRTMPESFSVPASPAVAIWDKNGALAYFGPYSSGAVCGQGDDFVEATLASLKHDQNPSWINHEAIGCLCQWTVS